MMGSVGIACGLVTVIGFIVIQDLALYQRVMVSCLASSSPLICSVVLSCALSCLLSLPLLLCRNCCCLTLSALSAAFLADWPLSEPQNADLWCVASSDRCTR